MSESDNLSPYISNNSVYSKNKYVYEVSGMLVNYIRKLKEKFVRDRFYLGKIKNQNATTERPKSAYSNYKSKVNENMIEKIKDFEMTKRKEKEERYNSKKAQREKSYNKFLKDKMEKIIIMHEKNEIKSLKSKMYIEQQEEVAGGRLDEYLQKEALVKEKVQAVTSKKFEEIQQKSNMNNFKLQEASQRYYFWRSDQDRRANQEFENDLKSTYNIFNKPVGVRNSNHLENLLRSGKLDRMQENQGKNYNHLIVKTMEKEAKFRISVENAKINKLKQIVDLSLTNKDKQEQAKLTKMMIDSKKEETREQLDLKNRKTELLVIERKKELQARSLLKIEVESIKAMIKGRFVEAINSKHIMNSADLLGTLKDLIPAEYLDNPMIIEELKNINTPNHTLKNSTTNIPVLAKSSDKDLENDIERRPLKSVTSKTSNQKLVLTNISNTNFNKSVFQNSTASINQFSGLTYEQIEMKLDQEILSLISTEKNKEELRQMNLNKEVNPIVKRALLDAYNKERNEFSKFISQKQK